MIFQQWMIFSVENDFSAGDDFFCIENYFSRGWWIGLCWSHWSLFRQQEGRKYFSTLQHIWNWVSFAEESITQLSVGESISQFSVGGEAVQEWIWVDLQKNASPRFSTFLIPLTGCFPIFHDIGGAFTKFGRCHCLVKLLVSSCWTLFLLLRVQAWLGKTHPQHKPIIR